MYNEPVTCVLCLWSHVICTYTYITCTLCYLRLNAYGREILVDTTYIRRFGRLAVCKRRSAIHIQVFRYGHNSSNKAPTKNRLRPRIRPKRNWDISGLKYSRRTTLLWRDIDKKYRWTSLNALVLYHSWDLEKGMEGGWFHMQCERWEEWRSYGLPSEIVTAGWRMNPAADCVKQHNTKTLSRIFFTIQRW